MRRRCRNRLGGRGMAGIGKLGGDVEAGALPGIGVAFGHQLIKGLHDRGARYAQLFGKGPAARELAAGRKHACQDQPFQFGGQLTVEGLASAPVEAQGCKSGIRTGLVRFIKSGAYHKASYAR